MRGHTFEFAWYRFRATFKRRFTTYLSVILLIGLTGGLAMASIAAARRTQSSYPTFLQSTNPSTLTMGVFGFENGGKGSTSLVSKIERLPDVAHVRSLVGGDAVILNAAGAPRLNTVLNVTISGSTDGYLTKEDQLSALTGYLSNPKSLNQIEVTPGAARIWNVHQGEVIPIGFYAPQEANLPGFGTSKVKPVFTVHATVTAIVAMNGEIIQDDVDRAYGFAFITPAMVKRAAAIDDDWKDPVYYAIQLRHGDQGLAKVEAQLVRLVPPDYADEFHVTSVVTSTVELAIKPESVALGAFGLIAALVCLILSTQSLSRQVRRGNDERRILQALGASHRDTFAETMIGTGGSLTLGVVVAVLVAAALSPLAPLGPVRAVYPNRGIAWDWTVLGLGAVILLAVLGSASVLVALANSPQHLSSATSAGPRRSASVRRLQILGLPLAITVGAHFALESPGNHYRRRLIQTLRHHL